MFNLFNFFRRKNTTKEANSATEKKIIQEVKESSPIVLQGVINAGILNVRAGADKSASVVGKLSKGMIVSVFDDSNPEWYQIKYNDKDAYIAADFVKKLTGRINANILNLRNSASLQSEVIGKLKRDDYVEIIQRFPDWYKIKFNGTLGFAASKFVSLNLENQAQTEVEKVIELLKNNNSILSRGIEPTAKIKVPKEPRESRIVAKTYNNFGGLLEVLCQKLDIDIATAIAVLAVESAGKGFGEEGNVIIRFENHLFYRFWGQKNEETYKKHFQFSSGKNWDGHMFRESDDAEWISFHGNQILEWKVFEFARKLNNEAALLSASYGAPQILGTNFKKLGYINTEDMLFYFTKDIKYQILALFDFFNPAMVKHLQRKEFTEFASYYNGKGQAKRYGDYIKNYYKAYKNLIA